MKPFLLLIVLVLPNLLLARELPPVPNTAGISIKTKALRECKVPPQIAILPPQIEKDYRECVNSYYTPYLPKAEKTLKKKGFLNETDKLLEINRAENFIRVYEFVYETEEKSFFSSKKVKKFLLCDDSIVNCYQAKKLDSKLDK